MIMLANHTAVLTLAQATSDATEKSLLEYIAAGGQIGIIIILLSLVAVGMIMAQLLQLRSSRLAPVESVEHLHSLLRDNKVDAAIEYCSDPEHESFLTLVFGAALVRCSRSPFGFLELKSALEEAGHKQVAKLYRMTDGIGLIASVAPMLGLLGTVVGMVGAFDSLTMFEGPTRPDRLAGNISTALITTVLGLIVAIPCTAAYTVMRNRIDSLVGDIGEMIEDLAAHLEGAGDSTSSKGATKGPRAGTGSP